MAEVRLPDFEIVTTRHSATRVIIRTYTSWGVGPEGLKADMIAVEPTGPGLLYFVLDTERDFTHPFVQNMMERRFNRSFTGETSAGLGRHGLHVADTYRQMMDAAKAAGRTRLIAVKGLRDNGSGSSGQIAAAIRYIDSLELPAEYMGWKKMINLSLGAPVPLPDVEDALADFILSGGFVVAAAGNDGQEGVDYPAAWRQLCLAIGSVNTNKQRSRFSDWGPELDLVAPGEFIEAAWEAGTAILNGTSMATPHAGGACALVLLKHFDQINTQADLERIMTRYATDLGAPGFDKTGWGMPVLPPYFSIPEPEPEPEPEPDEPGGSLPAWVYIAAGVVIVAVILYFALKN